MPSWLHCFCECHHGCTASLTVLVPAAAAQLVLAKVQQSLVFLPECLSVLLAVLLDNAPAQELFVQLQGLVRVCQLLQDKTCPRHMRLECASCLLVLLRSMQQASGEPPGCCASCSYPGRSCLT
jgi:hypothetical protein